MVNGRCRKRRAHEEGVVACGAAQAACGSAAAEFVACAVDQRFQSDLLAHEEGPDSFWSVELVTCHRQEIDSKLVGASGELAN